MNSTIAKTYIINQTFQTRIDHKTQSNQRNNYKKRQRFQRAKIRTYTRREKIYPNRGLRNTILRHGDCSGGGVYSFQGVVHGSRVSSATRASHLLSLLNKFPLHSSQKFFVFHLIFQAKKAPEFSRETNERRTLED